MKGKGLGRGLEEVSRAFLSSEATEMLPERSFQESHTDPAVRKEPRVSIHTIGVADGSQGHMGVFALCNISIELARQGYRVLIVDDDSGGVNVTRLMGLMDMGGQAELVFGHAPMGVRVVYRTPLLHDLLSGSRLNRSGRPFSWPERYRRFDFILFHLPYGRFGDAGPMLRQISLGLVLTATDPAGMLEAYRAIKAMHQRAGRPRTGLCVVAEKGEDDAAETFMRMARNVRRFLKQDLISYSYLVKNKEIETSMEEGVPLVLKSPSSEIRRLVYNISGLLIEDHERKAFKSAERD